MGQDLIHPFFFFQDLFDLYLIARAFPDMAYPYPGNPYPAFPYLDRPYPAEAYAVAHRWCTRYL